LDCVGDDGYEAVEAGEVELLGLRKGCQCGSSGRWDARWWGVRCWAGDGTGKVVVERTAVMRRPVDMVC